MSGGVYIAGPMRGQPAFGFQAFFDAEEWLRANTDFDPIFNPARRDEGLGFLAREWDLTGHEDLNEPLFPYWDADSAGTAAAHEAYTFDLAAAMEADNDFIRSDDCDTIVMLPGWGKSEGAREELKLAKALGRECLFFWGWPRNPYLSAGARGQDIEDARHADPGPSMPGTSAQLPIPGFTVAEAADGLCKFKEFGMSLSLSDLRKTDGDHCQQLPDNLWVGLVGKARAGKDTVGDYLVERYGFTKVSFAGPLKEMALGIDPLVIPEDDDWFKTSDHLSAIVNTIGWERAKDEYPEVRRFLQRLGTEGIRNVLGQDTWIDLALETAESIAGPVVFTDARFENELGMIEAHNPGVAIRVVRDVAAVNAHASESALDGIPLYRLDNSGTVEELHANVDRMFFTIGEML